MKCFDAMSIEQLYGVVYATHFTSHLRIVYIEQKSTTFQFSKTMNKKQGCLKFKEDKEKTKDV